MICRPHILPDTCVVVVMDVRLERWNRSRPPLNFDYVLILTCFACHLPPSLTSPFAHPSVMKKNVATLFAFIMWDTCMYI